MAASKPTDSKSFVLDHMNSHHLDSLSLFLRVYNRVPAKEAKHARLEDASLSDLVISTEGTNRYSVPIDPPLKSISSDLRPRLISMHKDCLQKLGLSDITVKEYRPPKGLHVAMFVLCLSTYIGFFQRANFLPGSVIHDSLRLGYVPRFAQFCYTIQPVLYPVFVGVHTLEAILLAFKRLRPHGVPAFSKLWTLWVTSNLIEGFGAWIRFGQVVKDEKEKAKGE